MIYVDVYFLKMLVATIVWNSGTEIPDLCPSNLLGTVEPMKIADNNLFAMFLQETSTTRNTTGKMLTERCTIAQFLTAFNQFSSSWLFDFTLPGNIEVVPSKEMIGTVHGY